MNHTYYTYSPIVPITYNLTFDTFTLLYFHTMIKIENINNSTYNFE